MNTNRECGCKSFRTCVVCETAFGLKPWDWGNQLREEKRTFYQLDVLTGKCFGSNNREETLGEFPGIEIIPDFISESEETQLVKDLDLLPWDSSQSGRRKQNFGPRANFKKRKVKIGPFRGFPECSRFVQDRFSSCPLLRGFCAVEQCSIEYRPETGASIEPHIDDCWVWGERIVQLNLLSDTALTCVPFPGQVVEGQKYNLADVRSYPRLVEPSSQSLVVSDPLTEKLVGPSYQFRRQFAQENCAVKIPLPARSLLIMWGPARYEWEHGILREDIRQRRLVIAYRELSPPYLLGGEHQELGEQIRSQAKLSC